MRIHGQGLAPATIDGLRARGFVVGEATGAGADVVLLEASSSEGPDLGTVALHRLEHPDALLLLSCPSPDPARLLEWVRAGLDDWIDPAEGPGAVAEGVRSSLRRREAAREQRAVMNSLEDRRRRAESEERELSDRLIAVATELETEHERLGHAHSALQNRVAQLVLLYRIGRNLSSHRNWDAALEELLAQMKQFLGAEGAGLFLRSQGGERLSPRAVCGLEEERIAEVVEVLEPRSAGEGLEETLMPLESLRGGPQTACADRREPFSTTVVPLVHRGRDLGCLVVEKDYADGVAFSEDYYFLVTIRTVVAEEVAAAQSVHELRRLQEFQERTLEQLASGILTVDDRGQVGLANRTAIELLGVDRADGIDLDRQLRLGAESPSLRRWLAGLPAQGGATIDAWIHPENGEPTIPVSLFVSTLPGEVPGETQHLCVLEDRRQRQALEAERRRAARQKELLIMAAEWAHDVRTPLTGILHSAELLAGCAEPERGARHFEVIRGEVGRINELVNNFLDYARPAQLKETRLDLESLVRNTAQLMEGLARDRECELRVSTEPVETRLDADQFRQVLLNLMTNALDVAPAGSAIEVRVRVEARHELAGGSTQRPAVVVEVVDRGAGVDPADIDRLFIPFFTTKSDGTGLGLAISDKIIRAHGGTLRYERRGNETIFRIVLPAGDGRRAEDELTRARRRGLKARG